MIPELAELSPSGLRTEGAHVAITYLDEHQDAKETLDLIERTGRLGIAIPGDIGNPDFSREAVRQAVHAFGRIDILVNNAAEQHLCERLEDLPDEQLERTFRTNIFSQFYLTRAVLPHMPDGGASHQHHLGDGISGKPRAVGLCVDQGSDCRVHTLAARDICSSAASV